jgi:AraC family transcriptional regulator
MIAEIRGGGRSSRLLLDSLLESLCVRLAEKHASLSPRGVSTPVALASHRLRRVLEFMDANIGNDIALADLVAAAGTSQFHFSRAFHAATGCSPYRYLIRRRIAYAKVLLLTGTDSLGSVSSVCGFNSPHQFAVMFKQEAGVGPKRFRMTHTAKPDRTDSGSIGKRSSIANT